MIEVVDVDFYYSKAPILQKANASISEGEFVGIFGPNGGGKTTFLQLLMGFLKPHRGKISLFKQSPKEARSSIGYVPQINAFDKQFPLTVMELVLMGCVSKTSWLGRLPPNAKKEAEDALRKVNLDDKKDAAFGTLSGGQAQRALIARALVSQPRLLLLDEPTASVDPEAEKEIHELLLRLKGSLTILMVTHDLQTIYQNVDRWLCINREVTSFLPSEVCRHFSHGLYHHQQTGLPIL